MCENPRRALSETRSSGDGASGPVGEVEVACAPATAPVYASPPYYI